MVRPRLLDLFCGAGGAAVGYHRAGFEVVGVDIKPQKHYPFEFHQADAMTYPLDGFDVIHASPPCQAYSMMTHITKDIESHPNLVVPIRLRLQQTGLPYVIENVYKAPLNAHVMLCGTMFNLPIIRHRYFESNCLALVLYSCNHRNVIDPWHGDRKGMADKLRAAMQIDWMPDGGGGRRSGTVSQAIPPAYTEFIGKQLMEQLYASP